MVRPKGNPQKYILEEQRVSENRSYKHKNIITITENMQMTKLPQRTYGS